MSEKSNGSWNRNGCGCSSFGFVIILGLIFALFGFGVGVGATVRIPFTDVNVSAGGAIGKKEVVQQTMPKYLLERLADNSNFFNHSSTLTIWVAEGMDVVVIGKQPRAPLADLRFSAAR